MSQFHNYVQVKAPIRHTFARLPRNEFYDDLKLI
jgi:hypothetical protein